MHPETSLQGEEGSKEGGRQTKGAVGSPVSSPKAQVAAPFAEPIPSHHGKGEAPPWWPVVGKTPKTAALPPGRLCNSLGAAAPSFSPHTSVKYAPLGGHGGGVVWCGGVVSWCGVVWCGVVWCGVVWCGVVWCGVVWCAEGAVTKRQKAGMSTHGYR